MWSWGWARGERRRAESGGKVEKVRAGRGARARWSDARLAVKYVASDARLKWADTLVNVMAVLLVVTMVVIVDLVVSQTPALFLRFAELEVGETDVLLLANADAMAREKLEPGAGDVRVRAQDGPVPLLDYTVLESVLGLSAGSSPRWLLPATVFAASTATHGGAFQSVQKTSVRVLVYDSAREKSSGIGRAWDKRRLGELEAHVSDSVLYLLGIKENSGARARVRISVADVLVELGVLANSSLFSGVIANLMGTTGPITIPIPPEWAALVQQLAVASVLNSVQNASTPSFSALDVVNAIQNSSVSSMSGDPRLQALLTLAELSSSSEAEAIAQSLIERSAVTLHPIDHESLGARQELGNASALSEPEFNVSSFEDAAEFVGVNITILEIFDDFLRQTLVNLDLGVFEVDPALIDALLAAFLRQFNPSLETSVVVVNGVEGSVGKWPTALGNVMAIELRNANQALSAFVESLILRIFRSESSSVSADDTSSSVGAIAALVFARALGSGLWQLISQLELQKCVPFVCVQHAHESERVQAYVGGGGAIASTRAFAKFTDALAARYGVDYPVVPILPLHTLIVESEVLLIYLGQVFWVVLLVLVGLGAVLVYALSQAEIEEKTYEFGMLRALGLRFRSLLMIMVLRGLSTAVPGLLLGLCVSALSMIAIASAFSRITKFAVEKTIPVSSVVLALCVGLLVPLIANIVPTRKALGVSLRDALDATRSSVSSASGALLVRVQRLDRLGIHWWWFTIGAYLLLSGMLFYYVLPAALVDENYRVFFLVMNISLIMMLFGLSVLVQIVQPALARAFLHVLLPSRLPKKWLRDGPNRVVVDRHLYSHRVRNGHCALLLTLSVGFIVFAGALIQQQINAVQNALYQQFGADVLVTSTSRGDAFSTRGSSVIEQMCAFLKESIDAGVVEEFSMVSGPLEGVSLSTAAMSSSRTRTCVYGIDDAFFRVAKTDLLLIKHRAGISARESGDVSAVPKSELIDMLKAGTSIVDERYGDGDRYRRQSDAEYSQFRADINHEDEDDPQVLLLDARTPVVLDGVDWDGKLGVNATSGPYVSVHELESYFPVYLLSSAAGRQAKAIDSAVPLVLESNRWPRSLVARATLLASKAPYFSFSNYESSFSKAPLLVYADALRELVALEQTENEDAASGDANLNVSSSQQITATDEFSDDKQGGDKIAAVLVRMSDAAGGQFETKQDAARFVSNALLGLLKSGVVVSNVDEAIASSEALKNGLLILFIVLAIMVDVLSFLMLLATMRSNVKHDTVEYAVLRSMGLSQPQLLRVYMYESVCLVLSSMLLGTVVGILVGVTLALQQVIIDESAFELNFPWLMYTVLVGICVVVSTVSPVLTLRSVSNRHLASILRSSN